MFNLITISLLLVNTQCLSVLVSAGNSRENPAVLIVSFDGFRYDYTDKIKAPNIQSMKKKGSFGSLINVFETKTFPNHHSLATGLYPESHGVLANNVYDPLYDEVLTYGEKLWSYSQNVTPIWILNEMNGENHHSGVMMWPGADFSYRNGVRSTFEQPWNQTWDWKLRVDNVINWFLHPDTPVNLAMMYIEEPDMHAHAFGPSSTEVASFVQKLDSLVGYLVKKLDQVNLTDSINVFLLSDHGMDSTDEGHIIDLSTVSNETMYRRIGTSPVIHIIPNKGFEQQVYNDLKNASAHLPMSIYNRETTPVRWHNTNCRRFPPILAVANEGYAFQDLRESIKYYAKTWHFTPTPDHKYGLHGYDNTLKKMHPFFVAWGPNIRQGYEVKPFNSVDLYSLWAHLLNIPESQAPSNGSYKTSSAVTILQSENDITESSFLNFLLIAVSILGLGFLLGLIAYFTSRWCHNLCQRGNNTTQSARTTNYRRINTHGLDIEKRESPRYGNEEDFSIDFEEEEEIEEQHLLHAYSSTPNI